MHVCWVQDDQIGPALPSSMHLVLRSMPRVPATPLRHAAGRCIPEGCLRVKVQTPEGKAKEVFTCQRCHSPPWEPLTGQMPGLRPSTAACCPQPAAASAVKLEAVPRCALPLVAPWPA